MVKLEICFKENIKPAEGKTPDDSAGFMHVSKRIVGDNNESDIELMAANTFMKCIDSLGDLVTLTERVSECVTNRDVVPVKDTDTLFHELLADDIMDQAVARACKEAEDDGIIQQ